MTGAIPRDAPQPAIGADSDAVIAQSLFKTFRIRGARGRGHHQFTAVDDVSFSVGRGQSLGIVGESGSGKTTVARMLSGLERATGGTIVVAGRDRSVPVRNARERRRRGRELQIVFQDPYTSLDPRQRIGHCLDEVLRLHTALNDEQRRARVGELLDHVGLDERHARSRPRELSGGQRQRAAIARALAAEPIAIVLDEAVSALDVSIQAQVLNLLNRLRTDTGVAYIFISHNLAVVRQVTDEALVLQRGRVVERGPTEKVLDRPQHEYTRRLLASIPEPGWDPHRLSAKDHRHAAPTAEHGGDPAALELGAESISATEIVSDTESESR
ncbi:MAG: ATP-binding cassette domain-containing protein [Solirubrobacteraceae bacterium]